MDFQRADNLNQAIRALTLRHRARAAARLSEIGLHPGQEVLLLELARSGPAHQAQLADAIGCEPPSVTLMANKLEAAGHVRRRPSPTDRRLSIVELTESGEALIRPVKKLWRALAAETVGQLSAHDVEEVTHVLRRLADNLNSAKIGLRAVERRNA
jgi:DNA-binding MarR family transcriptional regulator